MRQRDVVLWPEDTYVSLWDFLEECVLESALRLPSRIRIEEMMEAFLCLRDAKNQEKGRAEGLVSDPNAGDLDWIGNSPGTENTSRPEQARAWEAAWGSLAAWADRLRKA